MENTLMRRTQRFDYRVPRSGRRAAGRAGGVRVRDAQDRTRALAPLRKAEDAIEVDTSERTTDDVVARMLDVVERQRCCTRS